MCRTTRSSPPAADVSAAGGLHGRAAQGRRLLRRAHRGDGHATCRSGLGEPLFDKLDADIAYAMMGINAVKGVEIGAGFASVAQRGSTHGDALTPQGFLGNNAGGVLGGITTGQDLEVVDRHQADQLDPHAARSRSTSQGQPHRGRDQGPPRPLRRHPRHADRRGHAGAGGDGPRAAPPRAVRRCQAGGRPHPWFGLSHTVRSLSISGISPCPPSASKCSKAARPSRRRNSSRPSPRPPSRPWAPRPRRWT